MSADGWLARRSTRAGDGDVDEVRRLLRGGRVDVVIPARNEAETVGPIVASIRAVLAGVVSEVVVVDDASGDGTHAAAEAAGARVVRSPSRLGKGRAMRLGTEQSDGDVVVFLDADVPDFSPRWVASLVLPLLRDESIVLVKAAYDRPLTADGVAHPRSGGRVTRLVAVPVLNLVAPELTVIAQPLAGETAARRSLLEKTGFADGYSVELAMLLDTYALAGLDGLAQVDLGERAHRHQSDQALGAMATDVLRAAARYAGWPVADAGYAHVRRGAGGSWTHIGPGDPS